MEETNEHLDLLYKKQSWFMNSGTIPNVDSVWKRYDGGEYIVKGYSMDANTKTFQILYSHKDSTSIMPWSMPWSSWEEAIIYKGDIHRRFSLVTLEINK
jgi:hypothetical protein